ncbi:MAG: hypothetical protein ACTSW1_15420 [Candidatus Hodarchaeales archaeon]
MRETTSNKIPRWKQLEKEFNIYIRNKEIFFAIISSIDEPDENKKFRLLGIEINVPQFDKGKKLTNIKTPDILYVSSDKKEGLIFEIVASFSENYGENELIDLSTYKNKCGLDKEFLEQYLTFVMPEKDISLFEKMLKQFLRENPSRKEVFDTNFGMILWEELSKDHSLRFNSFKLSYPPYIKDMINSLTSINPNFYFKFAGTLFFLRSNPNKVYTCIEIFKILMQPGIFRKGVYQRDEFEFTLGQLYQEIKKRIKGNYPGIRQPPFPRKQHIKQCIEVLLLARQIKLKEGMNQKITGNTVFVSSLDFFRQAFKKHRNVSRVEIFYCRHIAKWEEKQKKQKKHKNIVPLNYFNPEKENEEK